MIFNFFSIHRGNYKTSHNVSYWAATATFLKTTSLSWPLVDSTTADPKAIDSLHPFLPLKPELEVNQDQLWSKLLVHFETKAPFQATKRLCFRRRRLLNPNPHPPNLPPVHMLKLLDRSQISCALLRTSVTQPSQPACTLRDSSP